MFRTDAEFRREFEANIASGGLFVRCREPLALRTPVQVELVLAFQNDRVVLSGEVVHCVPAELAGSGATPGVAVQFLASAQELRRRLARYLDGVMPAAEPAPPTPTPTGAGARRAPRATARVLARVETRAGKVAARTRDISRVGVLVSVPTDEIAVGESVRVTLSNPRSGDALEVPGRVVRQLEGEDGGVAAVGIEFEPRENERAAVDGFVEELASTEHSRRLGGISGPLAPLGLGHLLQMFAAGSEQGTLTLLRGREEGCIGFERGLLLGAQLGPTRGLKALVRLLVWEDGRFEFHARVDAGAFDETPQPLAAALLDAMRIVEEARRRPPRPYPPGGVFEVDDAAAGEEPLAKLEASILDLARVGMSVRKILDVVPEPDPTVLAAMDVLVDRRVLLLK